MFEKIKKYCDDLLNHFDEIPAERKKLLENLSSYIQEKLNKEEAVNLVYICTHNSRRSHFGQVWAAMAASYFNIPKLFSFSGGTEATAFNINAINALKTIGFEVGVNEKSSTNPIYKVSFGKDEYSICFSKVYDDDANPKKDFAAIMTCSDAEENCPFIPGVDLRIGTTYDDPKAFDGTPLQDEKYLERAKQIATETFYVFSRLNLK